jgi:hypothetical protein
VPGVPAATTTGVAGGVVAFSVSRTPGRTSDTTFEARVWAWPSMLNWASAPATGPLPASSEMRAPLATTLTAAAPVAFVVRTSLSPLTAA